MQSSPVKLLVIGFDGLDDELFDTRNTLDLDVLPLFSPVPATGPGWTSIYTGDDASTHNIRDVWGMERFRRYARNPILNDVIWYLHQLGRLTRGKNLRGRYDTRETTRSTYLWDTLNDADLSVRLLNLPITCPARPVQGVHVAGFPLIHEDWYFPTEIGALIPDDYPAIIDLNQWLQDPQYDAHGVWKRRITKFPRRTIFEKSRRDALQLCDLFDSLPAGDFEMIQFSFCDRFGHVYGVRDETEDVAYALVLGLIERLIDASEPDAVLIVSDHGFQGDEHTDRGVLGLGGAMRDEIDLPDGYVPSVIDVAPTIADVVGTEHVCDGSALTCADELTERPDDPYQDEKMEMLQRMRDIGYM